MTTRRSASRKLVPTPVASGEAANKGYVDGLVATKVSATSTPNQLYLTDGAGAQITGTWSTNADPFSFVTRDANGRIRVGDPAAAADAATKNYVDSGLGGRQAVMLSAAIQTANFNAVAGTYYPVNATSGGITATIPASSPGQWIAIKKLDNSANTVILSGSFNNSGQTSITLRLQYQGKLLFADGSGGWNVIAGDIGLQSLDARFEPLVAAGTTAQYRRGDKTWQTLNAAAVGLGSVNNTADSTKNVLSATKLTTARTINGVSFDGTANITVPPGTHTHSTDDITSGQLGRARLYTGSMLATVNGTPTNTDVWYGTQAQYDAIGTKDANTEYNIYAT
ncbi:minor tail protein [Gordonia phage DalanDe]|nr:minor tail protein [Gordonia phage DalanDe]